MPNNNKLPPGEHIRKAVKLGGGLKKVAPKVGRCHQAIGHWYHNPNRMEPSLARELSRLSGFQVSVTDMRPDVFDGLTEAELGYRPKKGKVHSGGEA